MKKIYILVACTIWCTTILAQTITSSATIKMKGSPSGTPDELYIFQIAEAHQDAFDNSWESRKMLNTSLPTSVNVFAVTSYGQLSDVALPNVLGLPIVVITNKQETNYSFEFSDLEGATLQMVDSLLDSIFIITEGGKYEFTAPTDMTIANRFAIYRPFIPDVDPLAVCHISDELQINKNPYTSHIIIKNENGDVVMDKWPDVTPQIISLKDLPKGRYTVEFNDGKEVFVISVKPDVKPAK